MRRVREREPGFRGRTLAPALALLVASFPAGLRAQERVPLDEAVRLALETHPSIGGTEARAESAAETEGVARSAWYPSLSAVASATRFQEPMLVAPLHGFELATVPEFDRTLVRGGLDLAWAVFEGGARSARVRGAEARSGSAMARAEAARQDLAADVVGSYTRALTLREARAAQLARLEALVAERARVTRMLAEGRAPEVERFRADAAIALAEADLAGLEAGLEAESRRLSRLIGIGGDRLSADLLVPVRPATQDPARPPSPRDSLGEGIDVPELAAARSAVRAAEAARQEAASEWFPRLLVSGGLRTYGSSEGAFSTEWQAGVGLEYPIFSGFARSRRVSAASAAETAAREELRVTSLAVADRADRALEAVRGAASAAEALGTAERHLAEVVRIERLSLREGAGVQTDYLRAEAELAETRAARARAVNLHVAARAELARALGELTPDWIRRNLESRP